MILDGAAESGGDTSFESAKAHFEGEAAAPVARSVRYPVELIDVISFGGGQRVTVRPVLPQDDVVTGAFFRALSSRSKHNRFFRPLNELPQSLLRKFTRVDYRSHLALIAEVFLGGQEVAVGEARYVVGSDGETAEFAVAIADEWQGRGLGHLLLSRLLETARRAGIRTATAATLASNAAMLRLAEKAGFSLEIDPEVGDLVNLTLRLDR